MKIKFDHIQASSYVDGPGQRVVLFVKGCPIQCPGCQSQHLWSAVGGNFASPEVIAESMILLADGAGHQNFTISGGEPMWQAETISQLVKILRERKPESHIIVYSGYTWEELLIAKNMEWLDILRVFENIDILVEGRFVKALDDDNIIYRGSRNQRPIDVQAALGDYFRPVVLDWSKPVLSIGNDGNVFLPKGLAPVFEVIGKVENNRMCGQSK